MTEPPATRERARAGLLWLAVLVSLFGSGLSTAGLSWFVLERTGSTVAVGLLWVLITAPGLVVPLLGGVLIDRVDRRRLGILLDVVRGALVLAAAALVVRPALALPTVYALCLLLGMAFSVSWPTLSALVQEIAPPARLVRANAALLISVQAGMMSAGALVGFAYARLGLAGLLLIDAATYAVSAGCLARLRRGLHAPSGEALAKASSGSVAAFLGELREGAAYLRRNPPVLAIGLASACMMGGVLSATVLLVALARDVLKAGAYGYGYLEAGWATGAVVGGLLSGRVAGAASPPLLAAAMLALLALGHALLPFLSVLIVAVAAQVLLGASRALGGVAMQSSIMAVVPARLMGRVGSAFSTFSTLLQVVMSLLLGWLAQAVSLPAAFLAVGALYGAASGLALRARALGHGRAGSPPASSTLPAA